MPGRTSGIEGRVRRRPAETSTARPRRTLDVFHRMGGQRRARSANRPDLDVSTRTTSRSRVDRPRPRRCAPYAAERRARRGSAREIDVVRPRGTPSFPSMPEVRPGATTPSATRATLDARAADAHHRARQRRQDRRRPRAPARRAPARPAAGGPHRGRRLPLPARARELEHRLRRGGAHLLAPDPRDRAPHEAARAAARVDRARPRRPRGGRRRPAARAGRVRRHARVRRRRRAAVRRARARPRRAGAVHRGAAHLGRPAGRARRTPASSARSTRPTAARSRSSAARRSRATPGRRSMRCAPTRRSGRGARCSCTGSTTSRRPSATPSRR